VMFLILTSLAYSYTIVLSTPLRFIPIV
jgi:hypothetical protein